MRSLRTPSRTLKPQALELLTSLVHLTRAQGGWLHLSEAQLTLTLNIRPRLWPKLKCTQSENLLHLQGPFGSLGLIFRGSVPLEVGPVLEAVQTSLNQTPLLEFVAQRLSNALERSQFIRELTSAREQSLKSLGLALEYRDHETKGHTDRVTSLALRLGQHLGLSRSELQALRWGSYIHDIGKIAIPDRILLKPGPLTKEERLLIESHVERGYEMASGLGFLPQATLEVIRYHHERWDGLGYPKGLAGESIPFLARIFAVVDVYDALVSARSYKPAWEPERAVQELRNQAGHQFDPELVSKFLETL